ncbi:MAG TPA: glycoside hydrolase family 2 TIM barrel-domain containing protein [Sphingobium sp.]|uniref:glycoside hydrolase family 2 TIM barrel-domain containing protein n=1 Tax=Sphingobium sp. TaxID=1912891 RepID=UPI002ED15C98
MTDAAFLADRRDVLALGAGAALLSLTQAGASAAATMAQPKSRVGRDMPFDSGWLFRRGAGDGQETRALSDGDWRRVDLPHDWSVEDIAGGQAPGQIGPFDRKAEGRNATGFTVGGEGWYRKHFRVDGYPADARIEIAFDGAYLETDIWLNGQHLGQNVHGYIPFAFNLTPHLNRGGDNVLAVRVRNLGKNSRWYSGSGLYRQVTLDILPAATHIARWGVGAWTRALTAGRAEIDVTTRIEAPDATAELVTQLVDATGAIVAEAVSPVTAEVKQTLTPRGPHLWSPDKPYLYRLTSLVRRDGQVTDRMEQPFGIRIVTFDPQRGMTINGQVLRLRGGCIHHDNGLLGACAYPDADERRIRLLQARGFNAIRSTHNPASRSLRNACDRLGMLVIDEAFDVWHSHKEPQDFSIHFPDHWEEVVRAMVLSARNSPSVILWSIGNEIPYRATDEGVEWEWKIANAVKRIDPTRPVTAGLNGVLGAPMIAGAQTARPGRAGKVDNASTIFLDVPGYNYRLEDIEAEERTHPERVVYASETFARDVFDYKALSDRAPYFLGEFVWTAMDYIGEAGIGLTAWLKKGNPPFIMAQWPWVNAWCGDIDLIGQQKASSLARDAAWGISPLEMAVQRPVPDGKYEYIANWGWSDELQSWTWPGAETKPLLVSLYTGGDRVELRLNGAVVGQKTLTPADKMHTEFAVPYAPGVLEAVAYDRGKLIGRRRLETVGPAARLRLVAEPHGGGSDRQSVSYVRAEVLDAQGRVLPDDQRTVRLTVDGPAELIGFGSANPLATGSLQKPEAQTYRGRALAILRSQGETGTVRVRASAEGLSSATAELILKADQPPSRG